MGQNDMMTLAEAALSLGLRPEKIEALMNSGELPGEFVEGEWLFRRTDVESWRLNSVMMGTVARVFGPGSSRSVRLVNLDEAATMLQMPREKVEVLVKKGTLPAQQSGGQTVLSSEVVENYRKQTSSAGLVPGQWQVRAPGQRVGGSKPAAPLLAQPAALASAAAPPPTSGAPQAPPRAITQAQALQQEMQRAQVASQRMQGLSAAPPKDPGSLELDLSVLDRLDIPQAPEDEGEQDPDE